MSGNRDIHLADTVTEDPTVAPQALASRATVLADDQGPVLPQPRDLAGVRAARAAASGYEPEAALSLARTLASEDGDDELSAADLSREQLGLVRTQIGASRGPDITEDPGLADKILAPDGDDRRLKDLIRARLFRSKAGPVKLGRYTILDRLGEGGMGVVYTAYDDKLDRKIAIKVMRTEEEVGSIGRARLLREAQAMAKLSHPNIVTVHEVGEVDGQVYVAMEYIRGQSLDQWLGEAHPWREVVDVFCLAGRGLAAAHQAGLVHRDFKPHNVLIGSDGAVKVLDFGLARAVGQTDEPAEGALVPSPGTAIKLLDAQLTRTGAIMGTPAYMAPEQHQGLVADARSDQFAFAVALYEGLHGEHPFDCSTLVSLVAEVIAGNIREPSPSASKVPTWLRKVVVRGLAVDPAQRYPTLGDMLQALARDPVAKRRRIAATAGLAGLVGALGFAVASLAQPAAAAACPDPAASLGGVWDDTTRTAVAQAILATEVPFAVHTRDQVTAQLDAYAREWSAMRHEACVSHRAGSHSARLYDLRTACLDQRRAGLTTLIDVLRTADASVVEKAVIAAASLPPLATCGDLQALTAAVPPPDDPAVAAQVRAVQTGLARVRTLNDAGLYNDAQARVAPLRAEAEALGFDPLRAEAELHLGMVEMDTGQLDPAEVSLTSALRLGLASGADTVALEALSKRIFLRAALAEQPAQALPDVEYGAALLARTDAPPHLKWLHFNNVGTMHEALGEFAPARTAYAAALHAYPKEDDKSTWMRAGTLSNLGLLQLKVAADPSAAVFPFKEAQTLIYRSLGDTHPIAIMISFNLGLAHSGRGDYPTARSIMNASVEKARATFGAQHPGIAQFLAQVGLLELEIRDYQAAKDTFTTTYSLAHHGGDGDSPATAWFLAGLASAEAGLGDWNAAIEHHKTAIQLLEATDLIPTAEALSYYAETLCRKGDYAECLAQYQRALAFRQDRLPPGTPAIALSWLGVGQALTALERYDEADAAFAQATEIVEARLGPDSPHRARLARAMGTLARARGDRTAAITQFQRSLDAFALVRAEDDGEMAVARFDLARALAERPNASPDDQATALRLATQAVAVLATKGPGWADDHLAASTWLAARGSGR